MAFSLFRRNRDGERTQMSFIDHLDALRGHLFRCVLAIAAGATIVGVFNKFFIRKILMGPTHSDFATYRVMCALGEKIHVKKLCMDAINVKMQSTGVSSQFSMFINTVLIGGFIVAFPYIFYQFWKFVKPALNKKELQNAKGTIFWVSFLFFLGIMFGYFIIAPYTVHFFSNFQIDDNIENRWTINSYLDTLTPLILGSGIAFQLPLAMYFLGKVNIVSSSFLKRKRKHALIIILILAGIITPPDMLSQVIVTIPLFLLYETSILLTKKVERSRAMAIA